MCLCCFLWCLAGIEWLLSQFSALLDGALPCALVSERASFPWRIFCLLALVFLGCHLLQRLILGEAEGNPASALLCRSLGPAVPSQSDFRFYLPESFCDCLTYNVQGFQLHLAGRIGRNTCTPAWFGAGNQEALLNDYISFK